MHHFFVDKGQITETEIQIVGTDVRHIRNVLRMQPGEELEIGDGRKSMKKQWWRKFCTGSSQRQNCHPGFFCSRDFQKEISWN